MADGHDASSEGAGWRSPTLWGVVVIAIAVGLSTAGAIMYRSKVVPMCFKFPLGRRIHSTFPIVFALALMFFFLEAGLYLIMDGESGVWHVLVGLITLIGGGYYSWWIYALALPDEQQVIKLEEEADRQMVRPWLCRLPRLCGARPGPD
jgi:hypothetical protein